MRSKYAWRTENWLRIGGEVFMVQQRWKLYREDITGSRSREYAAISQEAFPTDEWRLMSLYEILPDEDMNKLLDARERELE